MKNNIKKILIFLMVFFIPSKVLAGEIFSFDWVYYHYENASISANFFKFLNTINDIFAKYFSYEMYIKIIVTVYIAVLLIVAFEVLRGKKEPIYIFDRFIWNNVKDNILIKVFVIYFGYFIFLYPVPVVQVSPIITYDSNKELTVKAWVVDKELTEVGKTSNGQAKMLHVPMILAVPLGLIENFVYGFPFRALDNSIKLQNDSEYQGRKLLVSVSPDYKTLTQGSGAVCPISTSTNTVSQTAISSCVQSIEDFKPNGFSILNNTLRESAEIFTNVAMPFKKLESLLKFQKNYLDSITVQQNTQIAQAMIDKNGKILKDFLNNTEAKTNYMNSITNLYQKRVQEINKILDRSFKNFIILNKNTHEYPIFSAYIRAFADELMLNDMARVYLSSVVSPNNITNDAKTNNETVGLNFDMETVNQGASNESQLKIGQSAIVQRNLLTTSSVRSDSQKIQEHLYFLNQEISQDMQSFDASSTTLLSGDYINNIEVTGRNSIISKANISNKILITNSPFTIDSDNFKINFDIQKMEDTNQNGNEANQMLHIFWDNYKTKIFTKIDTLNNNNLIYYQPDITLKLLKNLGIEVTEQNINEISSGLAKFDKLTINLFVLDALKAYLLKKENEAQKTLYSFFGNGGWLEAKKLTKIDFANKYQNTIISKIKEWKATNNLTMGLAFDDFSFRNINQTSDVNIGSKLIMIKVNSSDKICQNVDGNYACSDYFFNKKSNGEIMSFLCEEAGDVNTEGMCILNFTNNKIQINTKSLGLLKTEQSPLFGDIIAKINSKEKAITNTNQKVITNHKDVYDFCKIDSSSKECAKFTAQNILKDTRNTMLAAINNNNELVFADEQLSAITFVYSGLLRNYNENIINALTQNGEKIRQGNPYCIDNNKVDITGAEVYNNMKNTLSQAIEGADNYIGDQITLIVSTLGAIGNDKLTIGAGNSWDSSQGNPKLEFALDFISKIQEGMQKSIIKNGGTATNTTCEESEQPTNLTKELCGVFKNFTNIAGSTPSSDKLRKEITLMVKFMGLQSTSTATLSNSMLIRAFNIYADTIGTYYNRSLISFNQDTFVGISKISALFDYIMGGNFSYSDKRIYNITDITNSPTNYKNKLDITSEICEAAPLKILDTQILQNNNGTDADNKKSDSLVDTSQGFWNLILDVIVSSVLLIYVFGALMLPFLFLLIFTLIAAIVGWIGAISIAYIAIINIIVLRNFKDINIINEHWSTPSQKWLLFFSKAILSSVIIYIFLVITEFMINYILIPLIGETLTMHYIVLGLIQGDELNLSMKFKSVMFIIVTIYFVYMYFAINKIKEWYYNEIITPTTAALKHAEDFAKKLSN